MAARTSASAFTFGSAVVAVVLADVVVGVVVDGDDVVDVVAGVVEDEAAVEPEPELQAAAPTTRAHNAITTQPRSLTSRRTLRTVRTSASDPPAVRPLAITVRP